ncbi:MAG: NADH:ubiquinone oxidoreductase [Acidobacteria bacterium]|nr:NADH:ubiquinone oxidoreductase [Acidobacteriota bacterium]
MAHTLYWLQAGGCGGDTWSLLQADSPTFLDTLGVLDVEVLWHPSLSSQTPSAHRRVLDSLMSGARTLDILCVEGAVIRGPGGTGMFDTFERRPKKEIIGTLARRARWVLAVGTCASFGGVAGHPEVEATGLQWSRETRGGFLGEDFRAKSGLPVINLPGCPSHPEVILGTFSALVEGAPLALSSLDSPLDYYGVLIHSGCSRNEYHEYRVEDSDFGDKGCLFFHLGCRGPLTHGPCNKLLWSRRNSKTRAGIPCFGCTMPDFPRKQPFFETRNIAGIPIDLPEGVDRAHYLAYKGMAAAAAPLRLKNRETKI